MFKSKIVFGIAAALILGSGWSVSALAATVNGDANASIVAAIGISQTTAMSFGNVIPHATLTDTVTVSTAGVRTTGANLTEAGGTVSQGVFAVTGSDKVFTITLPAGAATLNGSGGGTMTVDTWSSNPAATGTIVAGTATLNVGAVLNVGAAQTAGNYTGQYAVTVDYQ